MQPTHHHHHDFYGTILHHNYRGPYGSDYLFGPPCTDDHRTSPGRWYLDWWRRLRTKKPV